jgi:uncharacterized protein
VPIDSQLIAILRCPESRQPLIYFPGGETGADEAAAFLLCPASALRYRVDDGIPVMLVDEAERLAAGDVDRLVARARELGLQANGDVTRAG